MYTIYYIFIGVLVISFITGLILNIVDREHTFRDKVISATQKIFDKPIAVDETVKEEQEYTLTPVIIESHAMDDVYEKNIEVI